MPKSTSHRTRNEWRDTPDDRLHWTSVKYSIAGVGPQDEALTREEVMAAREEK